MQGGAYVTPRKAALIITLDLVLLLVLLLILSFYGMSHLMIFFLGLVFLVITIYDLRTSCFSSLFSSFLNLADSEETGRFKWLPVSLSVLLLIFSVPVLLEHGLVNSSQRWAMQGGQLFRVAIPAASGTAIVIMIALWTLFKGAKRKE